jgi:hypothetical protein
VEEALKDSAVENQKEQKTRQQEQSFHVTLEESLPQWP